MKKNILAVFIAIFAFMGFCYGEEDFSKYEERLVYKKYKNLKFWMMLELYFDKDTNDFVAIEKYSWASEGFFKKVNDKIKGLSKYLKKNNISNEQIEYGKAYKVYFNGLKVVRIEGIRTIEEIKKSKNEKNEDNDFKYRITTDGEGVEIYEYKNWEKTFIEIPEEILGVPVKEVNLWFSFYEKDKYMPQYTVSFPDGVKRIHIHSEATLPVIIEKLPKNLVNLHIYWVQKWMINESITVEEIKRKYPFLPTYGYIVKDDFNLPDLLYCDVKFAIIENQKPLQCKNLEDAEFLNCVFNNTELTYYSSWENEEDFKELLFKNCNLKKIVFEEGVKKICKKAFYNNPIEYVSFPKSLKVINSEAFSNCKELKEIDISNFDSSKKINIGHWAFKGCNMLDFSEQQKLRDIGYDGVFLDYRKN